MIEFYRQARLICFVVLVMIIVGCGSATVRGRLDSTHVPAEYLSYLNHVDITYYSPGRAPISRTYPVINTVFEFKKNELSGGLKATAADSVVISFEQIISPMLVITKDSAGQIVEIINTAMDADSLAGLTCDRARKIFPELEGVEKYTITKSRLILGTSKRKFLYHQLPKELIGLPVTFNPSTTPYKCGEEISCFPRPDTTL